MMYLLIMSCSSTASEVFKFCYLVGVRLGDFFSFRLVGESLPSAGTSGEPTGPTSCMLIVILASANLLSIGYMNKSFYSLIGNKY